MSVSLSKSVAPKSSIPSCSVCTENLNKSNRSPVECDFCQYIACKSCYKYYLLSKNQCARCMNCKKEWDYNTMVKKFDKLFIVKKYKDLRENILIDQEKSLMVATQPYVENILLNEERQRQITELIETRQQITLTINNLTSLCLIEPQMEKKQFIRKCTYTDCKGFLSSAWHCGICQNWSCPRCFEVIGLSKETHLCDPQTLATADFIKVDTKTCPKCSTGIFKIDGCDHMYCTECHTAFSWKTGRIQTQGAIHNPHYYDWLRRNGEVIQRDPNDIQCDRRLNTNFVINMQRKVLNGIKFKDRESILQIIRNIIHLKDIDLPQFRGDIVLDNVHIRAYFMLNRITEEDFKRRIQMRDKQNGKKTQIFSALNLFSDCATDILYKMSNISTQDIKTETIHPEYLSQIHGFMTELHEIRNYANKYLIEIGKTYRTAPLRIDRIFNLSIVHESANFKSETLTTDY